MYTTLHPQPQTDLSFVSPSRFPNEGTETYYVIFTTDR